MNYDNLTAIKQALQFIADGVVLTADEAQQQISERTRALGVPKLALDRIKTIKFQFLQSRTKPASSPNWIPVKNVSES